MNISQPKFKNKARSSSVSTPINVVLEVLANAIRQVKGIHIQVIFYKFNINVYNIYQQ